MNLAFVESGDFHSMRSHQKLTATRCGMRYQAL